MGTQRQIPRVQRPFEASWRIIVPLSLASWVMFYAIDTMLSYNIVRKGEVVCVDHLDLFILLLFCLDPLIYMFYFTHKLPGAATPPGHFQQLRAEPRSIFKEPDLLELLQQRAFDNVVVLVGFNYAYRNLLFNLLCRLQELRVHNFALVAFDIQAYALCLAHDLPCFPAVPQGPSTEAETFAFYHSSAPQVWDTVGFRLMTKEKSRQVLRVLRLGYDVLWTDVDVFWKRDPLPDIRKQLGSDALIGIQTDALWGTSANTWLNSGFYFVVHSDATVNAFADIVADAESSRTDSEQPSFNRVLCQVPEGDWECRNTRRGVLTRVLDRERYVHGALHHITHTVTRNSTDDVIMVHFNYRAGREDKEAAFKENGLWLLGHGCLWDEQAAMDASTSTAF